MSVRRNYFANPYLTTPGETPGLALGIITAGNTTAAPDYTLSEAGQRIRYTGVPGDIDTYLLPQIQSIESAFAPGDPATISIELSGANGGADIYLRLRSFTNAGVPAGDWPQTAAITLTSTPVRYDVTIPACSDTTEMLVADLVIAMHNGDALDITAADVLMEESVTVADFFAGGTPGCYYAPDGTSVRPDNIETVLAVIAALTGVASSAASADAKLDDVLLKTNTIGSLAVTVTSPVAASGTITVYSGDDYASADSRAITVAVADSTHAMGLDDVDAVVKLKATQATWEAAGVASTTDGYTVTFEATAAQTAAVTRAQHYELEAALANGHVVTLAKGSLLTRTNIPAVV